MPQGRRRTSRCDIEYATRFSASVAFLVKMTSSGRPAPMKVAIARPGRLVEVRGLLGELVRAPVHGGVVPGDVLLLGVDDRHRPLRGGPGVQVHQRLSVADGAVQDREVGADPLQRAGRRRAEVGSQRVGVQHLDHVMD